MTFDYGKEVPSKYTYLPKIGFKDTFTIKKIRKVIDGSDRFHFQGKVEEEVYKKDPVTGELVPAIESVNKSMGWHIECDLDDGRVLSVTSFGAFLQVFKKHNIQEGDTIHVQHVDKGEWEVTKSQNSPEEQI